MDLSEQLLFALLYTRSCQTTSLSKRRHFRHSSLVSTASDYFHNFVDSLLSRVQLVVLPVVMAYQLWMSVKRCKIASLLHYLLNVGCWLLSVMSLSMHISAGAFILKHTRQKTNMCILA